MGEGELALEETLENDDLRVTGRADDPWVEISRPRRQPVQLCIDTSRSMTGPKMALTAVALAVVCLNFESDALGVVAFENEPFVIARPEEKLPIREILRRFLHLPTKGYTHLEAGMRSALELQFSRPIAMRVRPCVTLLLTDGKMTAGRDPDFLADKFDQLMVIKVGDDSSSLEFCQRLARLGNGRLWQVPHLAALPGVMYSVVKNLMRGVQHEK